MADRGDTHYHVRHLNRWFAGASLLMLVSAVWMVLDDWDRSWKRYQREFRRIEVVRAQAELATPAAQAVFAEEARLEAEQAEAEETLRNQRDELDQAEADLREVKGAQFVVTENEKKAKQEYNWERFLTDEHRAHHGDDERYRELLERLQVYEDRMTDLGLEKLDVDAAVLAQKAEIARLRDRVTSVEGAPTRTRSSTAPEA